MKEVKLKRYAGPFKNIPFEHFIQSPIGLVPKDSGRDCCLIFHLSYPRGTGKSLNANTPAELCSVKYPEFDKAVWLCLAAGVGCRRWHSDFSSAFRNLGVLKAHWRYLVMKAQSPLDGLWYYFIDKCLPFGASISCAIFQNLSDAIAFLVRNWAKSDLINYLDDFLFVALIAALCNRQMQIFMEICEFIQLPVNLEKTFWASTCMVFLGMLIDTVNQTVSIPQDKIIKALNMINRILSRNSRKASVRNPKKYVVSWIFWGDQYCQGEHLHKDCMQF